MSAHMDQIEMQEVPCIRSGVQIGEMKSQYKN
jgi:hypothetical protein